MNWGKERQRLQQQYLQTRADALNIKYSGGRNRLSPYSAKVALSAAAPYVRRPGPTTPWDKLGQAFERSEQARQQLRNFERSRYTPQIPQLPGSPMPGSSRRCP